MPVDPFPAEIVKSFSNEFLCNHPEDVMLQVTVQERVHGKTLFDALAQDACHWTPDDWKSLFLQLALSLHQLQTSLGYVMWDTNLNNIMVTTLDQPTRLAYTLESSSDTRMCVTPPSRLMLKWMDSSSVVCFKMFSPLDGMRASASRLWLNSFVRSRYNIHPFCVPLSIVDWLNILIGFERHMAASKWT